MKVLKILQVDSMGVFKVLQTAMCIHYWTKNLQALGRFWLKSNCSYVLFCKALLVISAICLWFTVMLFCLLL